MGESSCKRRGLDGEKEASAKNCAKAFGWQRPRVVSLHRRGHHCDEFEGAGEMFGFMKQVFHWAHTARLDVMRSHQGLPR